MRISGRVVTQYFNSRSRFGTTGRRKNIVLEVTYHLSDAKVFHNILCFIY